MDNNYRRCEQNSNVNCGHCKHAIQTGSSPDMQSCELLPGGKTKYKLFKNSIGYYMVCDKFDNKTPPQPMGARRKFEQIADYAWLAKGRKYWNLRIGNPFCVCTCKIPLTAMTIEEVIESAKQDQLTEKRRFSIQFPDIEWKTYNPPPSNAAKKRKK